MSHRSLSVFIFFASIFAFQVSALEVRKIEFNEVNVDGSEKWLECSVEVEVDRDADDGLRRDPEFLDDLQVELSIGLDSRQTGGGFEFYQSRATLVSLERGKHLVRFYLPPEIVERDRISGEPYAYLVKLSRGDELLLDVGSRSLDRPNVKSSFLARVAKDGVRNEGVLLPQNLTPFDNSYPRSTPSFKKEGVVASPVAN